jgi:hypothetical protein
MPTIEIISIDSDKLDINQADFEFAIIEENKPISHRGLFYDFLLRFNGTILHLGNPVFKNDKNGGFFGSDLIDWDFGHLDNFKFTDKYKKEILGLLITAFDKSPTKQAILLTDKQTDDPRPLYKRFDTVSDLTTRHDNKGLDWNTLYLINFDDITDSLYKEVDWVLWNDWDPIGVNDYGGPDDEYRGYVPEIYKMLQDNKSDSEIAKHLDWITTDRMGLFSNMGESLRIARLLIKIKTNVKKSTGYNNGS